MIRLILSKKLKKQNTLIRQSTFVFPGPLRLTDIGNSAIRIQRQFLTFAGLESD
ncbi:hypothetical protein D1AOALGA4SA_3236 [Olavius algarvensis Delta 1 endosymbiont]|nr:hypothetical protein D1AOALGA4SA_3236 [Olavius algarvensis Delta 1 endosymbiont]